MKVVIPFTAAKLRPEVKQLGEEVGAIFENVEHCEYSYFCVAARLWARAETFLLVEHDVLPTVALLQEMWDCPEPWCHAYSWRFSGAVEPGETRPVQPVREKEFAMFCHKVSGSLLQRMGNIPRGPVSWQKVDFLLLGWLAQNAEAHQHGPVTHLHQEHPAWAATMTEDDWAKVGCPN